MAVKNRMKSPKTVRFSDLVRRYGRPESVTLWTDPKENVEFSRAIEENRVVTLKQVNVGTKNDFGLIGFHKERNVSFVVFPKPIKHPAGTKVVGINYGLIHTPPPADPLSLSDRLAILERSAARRAAISSARSQRKTLESFQVTMKVIATTEVTVDVTAADQAEARKKAQAQFAAREVDFTKAQIQKRVRKVVRKE